MADLTLAHSESKDKVTGDELAGWIKKHVDSWEEWRDQNYKTRWDEYYRMYRGTWTHADQTRESERSRIMGTELAQAVETQVAEIEDAVFARERWIGIVDDVEDPEKEELSQYLNLILDDYEIYGVKAAISEILLNGALYGTGIGKVVVEKVDVPRIGRNKDGLSYAETAQKYCVKLRSVSPRNFVIDPNARQASEGLGCAHVFEEPLAEVQKKISSGRYNTFPLAPYNDMVENKESLGELSRNDEYTQMCKIVEWHGLVPRRYMEDSDSLMDDDKISVALSELKDGQSLFKAPEGSSTEDMVEAIIVIVNDAFVARKVINPFLFNDRSFISFQFDTVPDRFWGRGVCEKGYNPQKALDAEIRARIDALGFSVNPMMGIDSTRIPRGERYQAKPGKNFLTVGNPTETLMPLKFPPPDPHTFQQTQELREMIQRGTGSYELPANVDNNRMAATSMSMVVGSMIKRSRRTLANIERNLLTPLVKKTVWRYIQFEPRRFPMQDYKFKVNSAMGIMAREFEQGQLVSLLSTVPPESPAFWMLIKGIYSLSNIEERESMIEYADMMLQQAMQPQEPEPDPKAQVDLLRLQMEDKHHKDKMDLEARKMMQQDEMIAAEARRDEGEGRMQTSTAVLQMVKTETEQLRAQVEAIEKLRKAETDQFKAEIDLYRAQLETMKEVSKATSSEKAPSNEKGDKPATAEKAGPSGEEILNKIEAPEVPDSADNSGDMDLATMIKNLTDLVTEQASRLDSMNLSEDMQSRIFDEFAKERQSRSKDKEEMMEMIALATERSAQGQQPAPQEQQQTPGEVNIERDENGLVVAVNGRPVRRDNQGRLSGLE